MRLQATEAVERGSKAIPSVTGGKQVRREHIQNRLVDLLRPYVCSMSQIDIVFGHEGSGRTKEVQEACRDVDGGVLYVDLQGSSDVGSHLLQVLTGEQNRGLLQSFRDLINGDLSRPCKSYPTKDLSRAGNIRLLQCCRCGKHETRIPPELSSSLQEARRLMGFCFLRQRCSGTSGHTTASL